MLLNAEMIIIFHICCSFVLFMVIFILLLLLVVAAFFVGSFLFRLFLVFMSCSLHHLCVCSSFFFCCTLAPVGHRSYLPYCMISVSGKKKNNKFYSYCQTDAKISKDMSIENSTIGLYTFRKDAN